MKDGSALLGWVSFPTHGYIRIFVYTGVLPAILPAILFTGLPMLARC